MAGIDNITPHTIHSTERARELGRLGGRAYGVARRKRKAMRDKLKALLDLPVKKGKKTKTLTSLEDFKTANVDLETRILAGMVTKAIKGSVHAAEFIRDTIGEKPTETFEDRTPQSPIILGTIPIEKVEAAKAAHDARQTQDMKPR